MAQTLTKYVQYNINDPMSRSTSWSVLVELVIVKINVFIAFEAGNLQGKYCEQMCDFIET